MNRKRILFVYPSMIIGGSTSNLLSLLNCLNSDEYEISLVLKRNEGMLLDAIPNNVRVLPEAIKTRGAWYKLKFIVLLFLTGYGLKAYLANRRIHEPGMSKQILSDFVAKFLSKRQTDTYDYAVGGLEGWADRYVAFRVNAKVKCGWIHSVIDKIGADPELEYEWMRKVDHVISVSETCNNRLKQIMPEVKEKAVYLENIMDTAVVRQRAMMEDDNDTVFQELLKYRGFKIISVCRLTMHVKGLDRMVWAAERLKEEGYDFRWIIVGDGEDRHKLEQMICEHDVADRMILAGKRSNPYPFIKNCDVMCMPSRWEGMPIVVTESKMLGIPPIVTRYLSVDEQIKEGIEGYIVENTDTAIIDALRACMDHTDDMRRISKCLLEQEYGNRAYIQTVEEILFHE